MDAWLESTLCCAAQCCGVLSQILARQAWINGINVSARAERHHGRAEQPRCGPTPHSSAVFHLFYIHRRMQQYVVQAILSLANQRYQLTALILNGTVYEPSRHLSVTIWSFIPSTLAGLGILKEDADDFQPGFDIAVHSLSLSGSCKHSISGKHQTTVRSRQHSRLHYL